MTPDEIQAIVDAAVKAALAQAAPPTVPTPPPMGETPEQFADRMRRAQSPTAVPASIAADAVAAVMTGAELEPEDQAEVDAYEAWVRGSGPTEEKVDV